MRQKTYPVDVISLCEADGQIRPLRIRFLDEEQTYRRLDIDKIIQKDEIRYTGAEAQIFFCETTVEDRICLLKLKYALRSHSWSMIGSI